MYCQVRIWKKVRFQGEKRFFSICDWNYTSDNPILLKCCKQVHYQWHCNVYMFSVSYISRGIVQGQKNSFVVFDWNHVANKSILLIICIQAHCWWQCSFMRLQGHTSSGIGSRGKNILVRLLIKITYLTNDVYLNSKWNLLPMTTH